MRVPLSWLREYARVDATAEQIAHALSISTAEVNGIERRGVPGDLGRRDRKRVRDLLGRGVGAHILAQP